MSASDSVHLKSKPSFFSDEEKAKLDPKSLPKHVAIVPDGNRRWAKANFVPSTVGHRQGSENVLRILRAAKQLGIEKITLYGFSTENWGRSSAEVSLLFRLMAFYLKSKLGEMIEEEIRFEVIGETTTLPLFLQEAIANAKEKTRACNKFTFILALNYGSRNEICRAFSSLLADYEKGLFTKEKIDDQLISAYLDTAEWEDPDLFIRTSGESRLSNFLLWQTSYSEIYISPVLWPDFNPHCFYEAILDYQKRNRRWGGG